MQPDDAQRNATPQHSTTVRGLIAVVGANIALGMGPWMVRMADTGPAAAAFWRIALALPILIVAAWWFRPKGDAPSTRSVWPIVAIAGLAFAGDLGSWYIGIVRTSLANATLFGNAASLIYPIYGFILLRAWPSKQQGLALVLAMIGGGLLLGRSMELSSRHFAGDLFCLLAGILYAVYFILMARARTKMTPVPALAMVSAATVLPLLILSLTLGEKILPTDWTPLIVLALLTQVVGQGLMIYALGFVPPLIVGIALLLQPVVSGTIGWVVYDERLALPDFIGAGLVAVALVLVRGNRQRVVPLAPAADAPKS